MTTQLPDHAIAATLHADPPRWKLQMHRDLPHDQATIWSAFTQADTLARWIPFRPDHDLTAVGDVWLTPTAGDEEDVQGRVLEVQSPDTLAFLWDTDLLRFDLSETDDGTMMLFTQSFDDRNAASSYAAGWHLCFAALELLLAGKDVPAVHGPHAMEQGWPELNQRYAVLFAEGTA